MSFLHRSLVKSFHFSDCFFDESEMTAHLRYSFNGGEAEFEETISFPGAPAIQDEKRRRAVDVCLRLLHMAAGVSYYKLYIPPEIRLDSTVLSEKEAAFFDLFYLSGLGEFSFRNNVSPQIRFPFQKGFIPPVAEIRLKDGVVVPVGGGKDSIVSIEGLRKNGFSPVLFSVGLPRAIRETIELSGMPSIRVVRRLSPDLMTLNAEAEKYGALNGHVPVTGIIAFILMLAAVLYDFSYAVLSNERSANVGNTEKDGRIVNHQWSKSIEFERAFQELTAPVLPDFHYFSLLRPLSELAIASLFSQTEKYDSVFTSCNRAFRLDESRRLDRWCCECDKCRFVFLALAPFMEKNHLISVFGRNMLDDPSQAEGFKELLGLSAFKPFECVGEIEESALSFLMLCSREEWKNDAVIAALTEEVEKKYLKHKKILFEKIFAPSDNHLIPRGFEYVIRNFEKQICNCLGKRR